MSFIKLSPATIPKSVIFLKHMHRWAIVISIFSNADKNYSYFYFWFLAFCTLSNNSVSPATPKPDVKSCNVCLCTILFFTLYRFVSVFALSFALCLLSTFNHQSKKKGVAFLKGFNAAPTNGRTDDGQTEGSTVMKMSWIFKNWYFFLFLYCSADILIWSLR